MIPNRVEHVDIKDILGVLGDSRNDIFGENLVLSVELKPVALYLQSFDAINNLRPTHNSPTKLILTNVNS